MELQQSDSTVCNQRLHPLLPYGGTTVLEKVYTLSLSSLHTDYQSISGTKLMMRRKPGK